MAVKAQAPPEKVRSTLGRVVREVYDEDWLREQAQIAKELTTGYRTDFDCPECGYRKMLMIQGPDVSGRLKAVIELMEQTEGRPGTDSADQQGTTIIVERPSRA